MNHAAIQSYFEQKQDEILNAIREVVEEDLPVMTKCAWMLSPNDWPHAIIEPLKAQAEVILNPCYNHVRAVFDDTAHVADPTAKPALILCHFDTVWPVGSLTTHPSVDEQGWAYGLGIFDMQSS
ncbi:MAG: hypothetical protein R2856_22085 [Caldilineaceae bacterium]